MTLPSTEQDRLRLAIFAEVELMADRNGGYISREELLGYSIEGMALPLIDFSRGIRNPADFDETLSVVSALDGPYPDHIGVDGLLRYSFRAGDPKAGDNRKLRNALKSGKPIIVFRRPRKNVYVPILPAYVIDEDLGAGHLVVAMGDEVRRAHEAGLAEPGIEKRYVAQVVRRRVHQPVFRAQVVLAYETHCAICRLHHAPLLDAAHIEPDSSETGVARVSNGLALCKIHHSAFDHNLLGITPDYVVRIHPALMHEVDGPMLRHGLQEMEGQHLTLPRRQADRPSRDHLEVRFRQFQELAY